MVAGALPAVISASPAGAATAPTITAIDNGGGDGVLPVANQGFSTTVYLTGTNFAYDNGPVSGTTNATGASVLITELSTTSAVATVSTSSTTAPGYYSLTLTDDNGSASFSPAFGVDPSPAITAISPTSVPQGTVTLMTVTGTGLVNGLTVCVAGPDCGDLGLSSAVASSDGTSATFYVNTLPTTPAAGGYTVQIDGANGPTVSFTVTGATITAIAPAAGFVMPSVGSTSTQTYTITGTGFLSTAVVSIDGSTSFPFTAANGVIINAPTVVNSTTITGTVTIVQATAAGDSPAQWDVSVQNPTGTASDVPGGLGFLEPGAPVVPSIPSITPVSSLTLNPGWNTVTFAFSAGFPVATGNTVTFSYLSFKFTGTVTGFDGSGNAMVAIYVPAYLSTTLTAAAAAAATSISVASSDGITTSTNLLFADTLATTTPSAVSGTTLTVPALATAHASGTVVQFPVAGVGGTGWTLTVNNGTSTQVLLGYNIAGSSTPTFQYVDNTGLARSITLPFPLAPGTYRYLVTTNGANLTTGTTLTFFDPSGTNVDNLSGTVVATTTDTATLSITVPAAGTAHLVPIGTETAAALAPTQNVLTLTAPPNPAISAGSVLTIAADTGFSNSETVTVASTYVAGSATIPLTTGLVYSHSGGEVVSVSSTAPTPLAYTAVLKNASGVVYPMIHFANTAGADVTLSGTNTPAAVGAGASGVTMVIGGTFTDLNAYDYVVTSTTPGVTFGRVTGVTGTTLTTTISVAAGTAANANVQYTVIDLRGEATVSSSTTTGLAIHAAPTVTAVSSMGTLLNGESATFTVTGTGFVATPSVVFTTSAGADTGTAAGFDDNGPSTTCTLISSTLLSCVVSIGNGSINGAHSLVVVNPDGGTSAPFANALTVSAPSIGSITPTIFGDLSQSPPFVLSGLTGFNVSQGNTPGAYITVFNAAGTEVFQSGWLSTTYAGTNSVSLKLSGFPQPPHGTLVITLGQNVAAFGGWVYADAPPITIGEALAAINTGASIVAGGSAAVVIYSLNTDFSVFMPGATVTAVDTTNHLPVSGITVTGVTVLPGLIEATVNVGAGVPANTFYDLQVMNPDGGVAESSFYVTPAPSITAVNGVLVTSGGVSFLNGTTHTLTISGTGFEAGAVVSATSSGVVTFGTATVNAAGTQLTVSAAFTSFTGATPIVTGLTVTNPPGDGSATAANELTINPSPTVSGTYFIPTFSSNVEYPVTGTGFQQGMTVTSSNAAYTVAMANVTSTVATLLVSTTSAATSGTSSTITFTNPDGGTVSFQLNGGPAPLPALKVLRTVGRPARIGRSTVFTITGANLGGVSVSVTGGRGVSVQKLSNSATVLRVKITVRKGLKPGVRRLHLSNANGSAQIAFSIKK